MSLYLTPSTIDWSRPCRRCRLHFYLISPNNLDDCLGELDGVDITDCTVTENFYSDTRIQASLTLIGEVDRINRNAFVRIVATFETDDGSTWSEELGTFIPTADDFSSSGGVKKQILQLESILYGVSLEKFGNPWIFEANTTAKTGWTNILNNIDRRFNDSAANDYNYTETQVIDRGETVLSALFSCVGAANNRLDVDGHGIVTIKQYLPPTLRPVVCSLTIGEATSIIEDDFSRSASFLTRPSACYVYAKRTTDGNEEELLGVAYSAENGRETRGYVVTMYETLDDVNPWTRYTVDQWALARLRTELNEDVEWKITTHYFPVHEGDVIELNGIDKIDKSGQYESSQRMVVKQKELNLKTMKQTLTLRSINSLDEG